MAALNAIRHFRCVAAGRLARPVRRMADLAAGKKAAAVRAVDDYVKVNLHPSSVTVIKA